MLVRGAGKSRLLLNSELLVFTLTLAVFVFYFHYQIPLRKPLGLYLTRVLGNGALYFSGLLVVFFLLRLQDIRRAMRERGQILYKQTWQRYRAAYLNYSAILSDLRYVNLLCVMFVLFIHAKHLVPLFAHAFSPTELVFDSYFVNSERELLGGKLAVSILQEHLNSDLTDFLSASYTAFYGYVAVLVFIFIFLRRSQLREEFFTSFVLLWFVGLAIVFIWPTWGPCFYLPESVSALPLSKMTAIQARLWQMKLVLDSDPKSAAATYFISGFPSLHFAVVLLGTVYLRKLSGLLVLASAVFLLLTFVSTIYFGWHYLWDDLAAIPLVIVVIVLSKLINSGNAHG